MIGGKNLALITLRQTRRDEQGTFFVGEDLINKDAISLFDIGTIFPLYLYTTLQETAGTLFAQNETTRKPNLASAFISAFSEKLGLQFVQDGGVISVTTLVQKTCFIMPMLSSIPQPTEPVMPNFSR